MKNTGVIRRIDELGRIVIPKEIRKILSIRDGENLEIYIEENKIILEKHLLLANLKSFSDKMLNIVSAITEDSFIITDREKVLSATPTYNYLIDQKINEQLLKYIDNRESAINSLDCKLIFEHNEITGNYYIFPIISDTDCLGLTIVVKSEKISEDDIKLVKIISKILADKISIN